MGIAAPCYTAAVARRLPLLLCALLALCAGATRARADSAASVFAVSRDTDLQIGLVTFGPGDDVYNYFGHNALIVSDPVRGVGRLYNYGMFHFGTEMLPSYMQGRLTFWVGEGPVRETFARYIEMNRSVRVQRLHLPEGRRAFLAHALETAVLPQNRYYLYHHYSDNCSTRLRDLIDRAVGGQLAAGLQRPARMSYRAHTRRYVAHDPFIDFVLLFWMNDQMERSIKEWDELFLPEELERQVARASYLDIAGQRVPLVESSVVVFEAPRAKVPARPPATGLLWLGVGSGMGLLSIVTALWSRRSRGSLPRRLLGAQHALIGLLLGLPGLLGFLMATLTEHTVTYWNENLWLANPLTFCMLPLGVAIAFGSRRAMQLARPGFYALACGSMLLLLLKLLLPSFDQDTSLPTALILPVNLGGALAHLLRARADRGA